MSKSEPLLAGPTEQVLALVRRQGIVRARDVARHGFSPTHLQRLYEQGRLERSGRGIYLLGDGELPAHASLAEAFVRAPNGVVCLISALEFHGLTTQLPHRVWMALPVPAHVPRSDWPPLQVVKMSGSALNMGIERHVIQGVSVPVYSPIKTVVDCFRFRNRVGLDVALEALRDLLRRPGVTVDQILDVATACRIGTVMRPYLEALA